MVQGVKRCKEGTKGLSFYREAGEVPFLDIFSASFVEAIANSEISGFGEVFVKRHKVVGFQQK